MNGSFEKDLDKTRVGDFDGFGRNYFCALLFAGRVHGPWPPWWSGLWWFRETDGRSTEKPDVAKRVGQGVALDEGLVTGIVFLESGHLSIHLRIAIFKGLRTLYSSVCFFQ